MGRIWTMTAADLKQRIRDRSVIIFAIVVPLALMGILNLVVGGAEEGTKLEPMTVAASVPSGDDSATAIVSALEGIEGLSITVEEVDEEEARARADDGRATIGLLIPEGFGAGLRSGDGRDITVIEGDGAGLEGQVLTSVLTGTVDRFGAAMVASQAAIGLDVPPQEVAGIAQQVATSEPTLTLVDGKASDEQLSASGALVAGQAGLFLLFTVGFGVLSLNAERDQGTLPRLLSMPMRAGSVLISKGLVSFLLGIVATTVLLVIGGLMFGVDFGSLPAVGLLVLSVVTAATSLMFVIARVAKTAEQANIAQSIIAVTLGIAGGAFFPLAATGLLGTLLDLNPIAAFTRGLGITSGGGGVTDIGGPVLVMFGFAVVVGLLSRLVPNRGTSL